MNRTPMKMRSNFPWRDLLITVLILFMSVFVCDLLSKAFDDNNPFASSIFILAVAIISVMTEGYAFGIAASVIGVLLVNCLFSIPFGKFSLSLKGYPLTFFVMLVVSILISTLTTRLKRQEAVRAEAQREKLRADLLRSISHDIRTPLASIVGASSVLMENAMLTDEEKLALTGGINRSANWLVRLVENILTVTKLSDGVALKKKDEVLEEVVGSAIVRFHRLCQSLPVHVEKPAEILFVPMNAGLIEQVLFNFLQNVVLHAKDAHEAVIRIEPQANCVCVSVSDDGCGIPAVLVNRIFDGGGALQGRACADGGRGLGIGLTVCKAIISAHGGSVRAQNNASGGATFSFILPLSEDHSLC